MRRRAAASFLVLLSACASQPSLGIAEETGASLPPAQIDLPPVPPAEAFAPRDKMPDGTWTVAGAIRQKATLLQQRITVRGLVADVYQCPERLAGANGAGCLGPHFYLVDERRRDKRLLVAGDVKPAERLPLTVVATLADRTNDFVASGDGLLVYAEGSGEALAAAAKPIE